MNRQHLTPAEIESYTKRTLSGSELLSVDDHCSQCRECRRKLAEAAEVSADYARLHQDLQRAEKTDHLSYEQMQSYVNENISEIDRELLEAHLEFCEQCAAEQRDLQAFKASMKQEAAGAEQDRKLVLFNRRFRYTALRISGLAAALVVVAFAATLPFRSRIANLEKQIRQAELKNEQIQHQLENLQDHARVGDVASLRDGGTLIELGVDQRVKGTESFPSSYRQLIQVTLVTKQLQTPPFLDKIVSEAGTLMSGSDNGVPFSLQQPVGVAVLSDRPTFRWTPVSGAKGYKVGISDTNFNEVESSDVTGSTEWIPTRPLKRGGIYIWQVTAFAAGGEIKSPVPPAPEARLKVLESEPYKELTKAHDDFPNAHLLMGILYTKYGVLDEAESEFQELSKANPNSAVARELLQSVQGLRKKDQDPAPTRTNGAQ